MKKIIAILLVLVVGFSAFAATVDGDTQLNLKASVTGQLFHGFTTTTLSNAQSVKDNLGSGDGNIAPASAINVDLTSATNPVGYYGFLTTGATPASVTFESSLRMSASVSGDIWEVPYQLTLTKIESGGPRDFDSNITYPLTFGSAPVAGGIVGTATDSDASTIVILQDDSNGSQGLGWYTFSLNAAFATGDANDVLPESTEYVGSIVASVVAE